MHFKRKEDDKQSILVVILKLWFILLASERSERDTHRSVQSIIAIFMFILGKWLPLKSELESLYNNIIHVIIID